MKVILSEYVMRRTLLGTSACVKYASTFMRLTKPKKNGKADKSEFTYIIILGTLYFTHVFAIL